MFSDIISGCKEYETDQPQIGQINKNYGDLTKEEKYVRLATKSIETCQTSYAPPDHPPPEIDQLETQFIRSHISYKFFETSS